MRTEIMAFPQKKGGLGESFNTIGFSGTITKPENTDELFLMGRGIDLGNLTLLERRAKKKLLTKTVNLILTEIAKEDENWKWHARFEASLLCQDELTESEHRSYSSYCKQRCCLICLGIRKGQIVNTYLPILEDMADPHFLTLTLVAVKKDELRQRFKDIAKAIRTLIARYKKRHERKKGMKFYGLWSLESNFNPIALTYNPHIHMILPSEYAAQTFWNDWVEYWKERNVKINGEGAQKYRRVKKNRKKDLIEIVKYGSKIFTEPDIAKRMKYKLPRKPSFIHVRALYNILVALDGIDVFNTFGFELPKRKKPRKYSKKATGSCTYQYDLADADWINEEQGLKLAKYKIPNELQALLDSRVDTELE